MPNITQLQVIDSASTQTYFIVVNNNLARRFNFQALSDQISSAQAAGVPVSSLDIGKVGQIAYDENYVYICVAENTWRRMSASTF